MQTCRPHRTLIGVIAGLAMVVTLSGCATASDSKTAPSNVPSMSLPTAERQPYTTKGDNGQVRVVGHGFSLNKGIQSKMLSYGLVLENLSQKELAIARIDVSFIDRSGRRLQVGYAAEYRPGPATILPRRRHGLGESFPVGRDAPKVAAMRVTILETSWLPNNAAAGQRPPKQFTSITTSQIQVDGAPRSAAEQPSVQPTLSFMVDSGFARPVTPAQGWAVFYDPSGKITGGSSWTDPNLTIAPGRNSLTMQVQDGVPTNRDDDRTEVYLTPITYPE
jgi:hypothetical protein